MGIDHTGFRVHTDQFIISNERHESAAHQTPPEFNESRTDWRSESCESSADLGATVRYTLHPHPVPSQAQDHRGNSLSDIFGHSGVHTSEYFSVLSCQVEKVEKRLR